MTKNITVKCSVCGKQTINAKYVHGERAKFDGYACKYCFKRL